MHQCSKSEDATPNHCQRENHPPAKVLQCTCRTTRRYVGSQILIMDNHNSYESLSLLEAASTNGITVLTIPPHTIQYLCPLDRAVFGPFQSDYDSVCSDYTSSSVNAIVNKVKFLKLLNQAFDK